jgi:hypothetical protein
MHGGTNFDPGGIRGSDTRRGSPTKMPITAKKGGSVLPPCTISKLFVEFAAAAFRALLQLLIIMIQDDSLVTYHALICAFSRFGSDLRHDPVTPCSHI